MVDDADLRLKDAGPSCAVEALGFNEVPTAGDEFEVYADEKSARAVVGDRLRCACHDWPSRWHLAGCRHRDVRPGQ